MSSIKTFQLQRSFLREEEPLAEGGCGGRSVFWMGYWPPGADKFQEEFDRYLIPALVAPGDIWQKGYKYRCPSNCSKKWLILHGKKIPHPCAHTTLFSPSKSENCPHSANNWCAVRRASNIKIDGMIWPNEAKLRGRPSSAETLGLQESTGEFGLWCLFQRMHLILDAMASHFA